VKKQSLIVTSNLFHIDSYLEEKKEEEEKKCIYIQL